jgi:UDP-N-acetylmuramate dehydrogenase
MPKSTDALVKPFAYYNTGGLCKALYAPSSMEELAENIKEIKRQGLNVFLLGGGTNSLVMDEPWDGAVIVFKNLNKMVFRKNNVIAGAGVVNSDLAKACLDRGLSGVAWMYRLPGQLGGTVRMNARCYGGEISEVVTKVWAVTPAGEIKLHEDRAMFRGYKDTIFMENSEIIAQVEIELVPGERDEISTKMDFCEKDRESKGQFVYPTCGCVFKNDYEVGVPSGLLLDQSGVKSLKHKGTEINPFHANFVYNVSADSRAILETTIKMREMVYEKFGVWMEYEMEILGSIPKDLEVKLKGKREQKWKKNLGPIEALREKFKKGKR